jgi:hypothetical protein
MIKKYSKGVFFMKFWMKEISYSQVENKIQSGYKELFMIGQFRIVDAYKIVDSNDHTKDIQSHFIMDTKTGNNYEISVELAYGLVSAFYCDGDRRSLLSNIIAWVKYMNGKNRLATKKTDISNVLSGVV